MKVNSITLHRGISKNNNIKVQTEPVSSQSQDTLQKIAYNDLAFQGVRGCLVKPSFNTPLQEKLANKISTYLKILPENSKFIAPIVMQMEDRIVEFSMDKTSSFGLTDVLIKVKDNKNNESNLNLIINKTGQLKSGSCYEPNKLNLMFERTATGIRKIFYGNATYHSMAHSDNLWIRESVAGNHSVSPSASVRKEFNDSELRCFISEMAKKRTSFLVK